MSASNPCLTALKEFVKKNRKCICRAYVRLYNSVLYTHNYIFRLSDIRYFNIVLATNTGKYISRIVEAVGNFKLITREYTYVYLTLSFQ